MRGNMMKKIAAGLLALLLCAMSFPGFAAQYRDLKVGMTGEDVQRFKIAMYWLGYFTTDKLDGRFTETTEQRVKQLQKNNGLPQTGVADAALQELVFSGKAVKTDTAPRPSPTPKPPLDLSALLPPRTAEGFLTEDAKQKEFIYTDEGEGVWIYLTSSLSIDIRRYQTTQPKLVWYEADVHCSPETSLVAYTNGDRSPGASLINPITFARERHMVLGISDDHFGYRIAENDKGIPPGIIIREGKIITEKTRSKESLPNLDILAVFEDGSMKTFDPQEHTAQEYLAMGVKTTYAFGPALVKNGELTEYMLRDEYYTFHEPRMAMGMIEPWHYFILCVEGRMDDRSQGVYLTWLADKMLAKGAVEAINLDGGGTSIMTFMGQRLNKKSDSVRPVGSMTGFGVSDSVPGK